MLLHKLLCYSLYGLIRFRERLTREFGRALQECLSAGCISSTRLAHTAARFSSAASMARYVLVPGE